MSEKKYVEIEWRLAGGVSTLESGFQIGWIEDEQIPILCLLADRNGEVFAKFFRDKTIAAAKDPSRAEQEAIEGVKKLVLKW
jgi:hypothetical protein